MYHAGQIVFSLTLKKPVQCDSPEVTGWQWAGHPRGHQTTHFIKDREHNGINDYKERYVVATPKTVEEAEDLLSKGLIQPAPVSSTHHWKCGHWKSCCKCEDKT